MSEGSPEKPCVFKSVLPQEGIRYATLGTIESEHAESNLPQNQWAKITSLPGDDHSKTDADHQQCLSSHDASNRKDTDCTIVKSGGSRTQYFSLEATDEDDEDVASCSRLSPFQSPHNWQYASTKPSWRRLVGLFVVLVGCLLGTAAALYFACNAGVKLKEDVPVSATRIERSPSESSSPQVVGAKRWAGNPECWKDGFTFSLCCDSRYGKRGNAKCWDSVFSYSRCCVPSQDL